MTNRLTLAAALAVAIAAMPVAACDSTKSPTSPTTQPTISSFSVSPTSGPAGTLVAVTWTVTPDTSRVAIAANAGANPGTGFAATGSLTVSPTVTTTYTLTASNPFSGSNVSATATFTVK
jgi:ABC-type oligopeptide transport system substrate-binding subunit